MLRAHLTISPARSIKVGTALTQIRTHVPRFPSFCHSNMKEEHGVALPCWETAQKVINGTYEMELYAAEYEANGEDWVPGRSLTPHTLFSSLSPSHNTLLP